MGSLVFRMASASFRWGGEFTPLARGPRVVGLSHPVPLPSTVLGTLAELTGYSGGRLEHCGWRRLLEEKLGGCNLRGPYIYTGSGSEGGGTILVHHYMLGLLEVSGDGGGLKLRRVDVLDVGAVDRTATSLRHDTRTVVEQLLYSQRIFNYKANVGIVVEVHGSNCGRINLRRQAVRFGGEGYIARVEEHETAPLYELVKNCWEGRGRQKRLLVYVATPLLLAEYSDLCEEESPVELTDRVRKLLRGEGVKLPLGEMGGATVAVRAPSRGELMSTLGRVAEGLEAKQLRVKLDLLGLGWDMVANTRRPVVPVVQPGSILVLESESGVDPVKLYEAGVGALSEAGWGTVIPLIEYH